MYSLGGEREIIIGKGVEELLTGLPDGIVSSQKIPIWVNFGGSCNGRCWYILWTFGLFCSHLVYFMVIWYIFPVLLCCTKKNLATPVVKVEKIHLRIYLYVDYAWK
jgi:hypothetical protein